MRIGLPIRVQPTVNDYTDFVCVVRSKPIIEGNEVKFEKEDLIFETPCGKIDTCILDKDTTRIFLY